MAQERPEQDKMTVMSLGQHLEELRWRIIKCLVAVGAAFVVCLIFRDQLRVIVERPHVEAMTALDLDTKLKFSRYFEGFVAQLKVCVVFALVLVSPFVVYQVWSFVAPGLFRHERHRVLKLTVACMACFVASVAFGYFLFVPVALRYLVRLAGGWAEPMLMIGSYLSLFFLMTMALALAFQTPVVVYYLIRWGVMDVESLRKHRKGVILGSFILAAVITPPDPLTQMMMALTLIVLYDLGGLVAAPSWSTLKGFVKFTGSIVLVGAVFVAWFRFWPVAEISVLRGTVRAGELEIEGDATARAIRGTVCSTGEGAGARIAFGGEDDPVVYLAGDARLQIHGPDSMSLYAGESLVANPDADSELTVRTGPATVSLAGVEAELSVPDEDTLTVAVLAGWAQVKAGGQTRQIAAGQTATFRRGGEPADLSGARQRWRELIEGHEPAEPAASP